MVRRYIHEANLFKNNALNKIKIWLKSLIKFHEWFKKYFKDSSFTMAWLYW
jgi:hypothetical protein